jgi:hypothetical protein
MKGKERKSLIKEKQKKKRKIGNLPESKNLR